MESYRPVYFQLFELVPKDVYYAVPHSTLWMFFDDRILMAADALRVRYGEMVCNDWNWGGTNQYRGYRPNGCGVGAEYSQHKFGRAIDLVPTQTSAEDIRKDLAENPIDEIVRVETGTPHIHIDCANVLQMDGRIIFFNGG